MIMLAQSVAPLVLDVGGATRYCFHLTNGKAVIRDDEGIDFSVRPASGAEAFSRALLEATSHKMIEVATVLSLCLSPA